MCYNLIHVFLSQLQFFDGFRSCHRKIHRLYSRFQTTEMMFVRHLTMCHWVWRCCHLRLDSSHTDRLPAVSADIVCCFKLALWVQALANANYFKMPLIYSALVIGPSLNKTLNNLTVVFVKAIKYLCETKVWCDRTLWVFLIFNRYLSMLFSIFMLDKSSWSGCLSTTLCSDCSLKTLYVTLIPHWYEGVGWKQVDSSLLRGLKAAPHLLTPAASYHIDLLIQLKEFQDFGPVQHSHTFARLLLTWL